MLKQIIRKSDMKLIHYMQCIFLTVIISCNGEQSTISVNTPTIQCGMCQKTIEMGLKKIEGVSNSMVDLATKKTKVIYDSEIINISDLEKVISELGYQANKKLANPVSYESLPACCKIGGMDHK
jgi:copper chaperone CopZ